jgi:hypothetical protein
MYSNTKSPPVSMLCSSHGGSQSKQRREETEDDEKDHLPERAEDRRRRRQRQGAQEQETAQRHREAKKPFYLTLDGEGKPYRQGRPAWIMEIGKLASGLDPSCTDIRSQTYESVTLFKTRLSESFDYSGTLNDGYLRSLMGRAVTSKRAELIKKIKNGEPQPLHIDHQVWYRLIKLAASRQCKEKSEQGRYANAMRRTYGRTGSGGVHGVRERLRERFNRSPDPDEMEAELNRGKGFGGVKQKRRMVKLEKESKQGFSENDSMASPSGGRVSGRSISDSGHGASQKHYDRATDKVSIITDCVFVVDGVPFKLNYCMKSLCTDVEVQVSVSWANGRGDPKPC